MTVHCLQNRRFVSAKRKVQTELVNYYLKLEDEQRLWLFTTSICSHAQGHYFTSRQAERLVVNLSNHYGIRMANIETAVAFNPFGRNKNEEKKVIRFKNENMSNKVFEDQLFILCRLMQEQLLEYRQALDLVLHILDNYPAARRGFAGTGTE